MASGPASVRLLPPACTRVPDVAKAVAAPCVRVRPCPSVDPEGSQELKQQSLSDCRSSESPDALALASSSAAAPSGGSQLAGCGTTSGRVVFVREDQDFQEGDFVAVFNPQGGKMIGRILSRSGDMSSSSTSVSVQLMALQHQVPPQVLRAEEKRLGVRLLSADREIFFTRSVQVTAPASILGEKLPPVSVVPADIDNPEHAGSYLDLVPPTAMLARFVLNSTEPVTLSHLSPHDILLPVPDSETKHDAGKMAVQVDTGGRGMSLISDAPTRDKTVGQKRAPPLCKGLRERCIGGAPSFTFDPHSFLKHPEKIGSSAFAALVEEPLCTPSTTETEGQKCPRKTVGESPSTLRSATPVQLLLDLPASPRGPSGGGGEASGSAPAEEPEAASAETSEAAAALGSSGGSSAQLTSLMESGKAGDEGMFAPHPVMPHALAPLSHKIQRRNDLSLRSDREHRYAQSPEGRASQSMRERGQDGLTRGVQKRKREEFAQGELEEAGAPKTKRVQVAFAQAAASRLVFPPALTNAIHVAFAEAAALRLIFPPALTNAIRDLMCGRTKALSLSRFQEVWMGPNALKAATVLAEAIAHSSSLTSLSGRVGNEVIFKCVSKSSSLQQLHLACSSITTKGAEALAEVMKASSSLRRLGLEYIWITDKGAEVLVEGLKASASLQEFRVWSNQSADKVAEALVEGLKASSSLQQLHLERTLISDKGAVALAEGLRVSSSLQELHLSGNQITDKGAEALAEGLKVSSSLQRLYLGWNLITDKGAKALAEGLKANFSMQEMDLRGNQITEKVAEAIADGLGVML